MTATPHIVHLLDDASLGGVTRFIATLSGRHGLDACHTQALVDGNRPPPAAVTADLTILHLSASWSRLPMLAALRMRRGIVARRRPIVIVEHTYTAAFERLHVPDRRRFRTMLRMAYGLANRIVAVSRAQAHWMEEAGVTRAPKLIVIPSVSDTRTLDGLALPQRRPGAPLRLGALGRYAPEKGFDVLLAAMRRLPPHVAELALVGSGPALEALRGEAAGMANVTIGGPITDIGAWLSDRDCIVVPSRRESYGLAAFEARAAGRPLIASAVDGLPEQIVAGNGLLVPPDDADALAAAIADIARRDITAMGAAARLSQEGQLTQAIAAWRALLATAPRAS